MGQAQINVRTRACSGTFIARTKQAALTHNVRGKRLKKAGTVSPKMGRAPRPKLAKSTRLPGSLPVFYHFYPSTRFF